MNRSKNHLLYELFLDEQGASEIFEKTKHISLRHIVGYVIGEELPDSVADYEEINFAQAAAYKELDKFDGEDFDRIAYAIHKINEYHENK